MIDALREEDAAGAARLSAGFGWPHRESDWQMFLSLGHGLAWREGGRLGGTAMWFPLDDAHASIGLVQVAPELQGRGIGRRFMQALMAAAQPRSLLLHATAAGAGLYATLGFVAGDVVRQWQGVCRPPEADTATTRRATEADREAILRLDAAATGLGRAAVITACLNAATTVVAGPPGALAGYAMRRRFGRGNLIGPVIAADQSMAIALVAALCEPGFLRVDLPSDATSLAESLAAMGLTFAGEVQAMTTGSWPVSQHFGLVSQALG